MSIQARRIQVIEVEDRLEDERAEDGGYCSLELNLELNEDSQVKYE